MPKVEDIVKAQIGLPDRMREAPRALADVDERTAGEVKAAMSRIVAAGKARDADKILENYDTELMLDEALAQVGGVQAWEFKQPKARTEFRNGVRQGFQRNEALWGATRFEAASIKDLGDRRALAYVRVFKENRPFRMRWWLTARSGAWRLYDWEDLDVSLRSTALIAALADTAKQRPAKTQDDLNALVQAIQAIGEQNLERAKTQLQRLDSQRFDPRFAASYRLAQGLLAYHENRFEDSLREWKMALGENPDLPILFLYQGAAHNRLNHAQEALEHLERFRALLNDDAEVCHEFGFALQQLRRFPEAVVQYRKALDLDAFHGRDAFLGLIRSLAADESHAELAERFNKLEHRADCYKLFADDCLQVRDGLSLEPIAQEMVKFDPKHMDAKFHLCLAKVWTRKGQEAVKLFAELHEADKQEKAQRDRLDQFLKALVDSNQAEHAYPALEGIAEAFPILAGGLVNALRMDDLRRAVRNYVAKFPGDPNAKPFEAMILAQDGKFAEADKLFQSAVAKEADAEALERTQFERIQARFYTGNALAALADIPPEKQTFFDLLNLCHDEQDEKQCEQILDAYAKKHPDAVELWRNRVSLKIRQKRFEEAILLFKTTWTRLHMQWIESEKKQYVDGFLMNMMDAAKPVEAYRAAPDAKDAFQFLCRDLDGANQREACKTLLAVHGKAHPGDPWIFLLNGRLHLADKDWDNAIEELDKARRLLPAPDAENAKSQLVYARYRAGQSLAAYQEIGPSEAIFLQLAANCHADKKWNELEALIDAHRPVALADSQVAVYEARMQARQKLPDDAVRIYLKWAESQTPPGGSDYLLYAFVQDMVLMGFGMQAYRDLAPYKDRVFGELARTWTHQKKTDRLAKLLVEHAEFKPGDAKVEFYRGELHFLKGEYAEAQKSFTRALAQTPPQSNFLHKARLQTVRIKLGKAVEILHEQGDGMQAFDNLCHTCVAEKEPAQLAALIAERRQNHRDDPHLSAWEIELHWMKKDYESAWKVIDEQDGKTPFRQLYRSKYDNYRVRTLVKLNRVKEAVQEAERLNQGRTSTPIWLLLAYAADGNVAQTLARMEKNRSQSYMSILCYEDPDLGPLLRSDAFKTLRDKFPPPQ